MYIFFFFRNMAGLYFIGGNMKTTDTTVAMTTRNTLTESDDYRWLLFMVCVVIFVSVFVITAFIIRRVRNGRQCDTDDIDPPSTPDHCRVNINEEALDEENK